MLPVFHSPRAERDLDAISLHIGEQSPLAAWRLLEAIDDTMRLVAVFPSIGEAVDHLGPGVRRITTGPYLIFFRTSKDAVELVRVLHGSRDIQHLDG
ncbi:Toxin ParE1 [Botrimarina colliarenosi]|uniref:Toxin ParE1 n=1 Tax=Botrimarina colliarenosi TaxID=2528001 RepID=A0A5C6AIF9_9BACT|nr:type II toxin-antitoxin system RelE/ParE family toxin [Botrimarina colliarenosi]TWT99176.1 Toxin ParE1 [Botrimarina colliarenosi]